jgi:hypothetical protein
VTHPVFCLDCEHVEATSRKGSPHYWLCTKFPRAEGMGFVHPNYWSDREPYMRCVGINGGFCCLFKRRRDAQMEIDA